MPPIRTVHEAVNLLASTTMIWDWQQLRGQSFANGITASGAYIISFRCSKPERALAELREIELAEGGLPYKLVLPIVADLAAALLAKVAEQGTAMCRPAAAGSSWRRTPC